MPNNNLAKILRKLSQTCTFPTVDELHDTTCNICLNDSMQKNTQHGPEIPVKLPCGHVFGMTCLLTWASSSLPSRKLCPCCRRRFLTTMVDTAAEGNPSGGTNRVVATNSVGAIGVTNSRVSTNHGAMQQQSNNGAVRRPSTAPRIPMVRQPTPSSVWMDLTTRKRR